MNENYHEIQVPPEISYMTQWEGFRLPEGHCIIDKTICGCGFTEFCIRDCNPDDIILCSPRKTLLQNKKDQHDTEDNIYYYQSGFLKEEFSGVHKRASGETEESYNKRAAEYQFGKIREHLLNCRTTGKHCVYLVTYDSFHTIHEALGDTIDQFKVVVDEFQSIFLDSYFKASIENIFFNELQTIRNVVYLSATPMLYKYLMKIPGFNSIPYYSFVWPESRVEQADIKEKWTSNLIREALTIIDIYKNRPLDRAWVPGSDGNPFFSQEAVLYVNSVSMICKIIKKAGLSPSEVNIICSDDPGNKKKIEAIKSPVKGQKFTIGHIPNPMKGEINTMFTFATKTTYLGADMYSDNARSFVFSDANIQSLSLDIQLDLPQILGRQRLQENPWKNECVVFYKTYKGEDELTEENFKLSQERKRSKSLGLLEGYGSMNDDGKEGLVDLVVNIYNEGQTVNYLGLDRDGTVVYNVFLEIADERAWEVSKKENRTKVSVIRSLQKSGKVNSYQDKNLELVEALENEMKSEKRFQFRFQKFCEFYKYHENNHEIISILEYKYKGQNYLVYYTHFGYDICKSSYYVEATLKKLLSDQLIGDKLIQCILVNFKLGEKYFLKDIKETLKEIYCTLGVNRTPKASDLEDYFVVKQIRLYDQITKKQSKGYQLISLK